MKTVTCTTSTTTLTHEDGREFVLSSTPSGIDYNVVATNVSGQIEVRYLVDDHDCYNPIEDSELADIEPCDDWRREWVQPMPSHLRDFVSARRSTNIFPVRIGDGHGPFVDAQVLRDDLDGFTQATHILTLNHLSDDITRDGAREVARSTMLEYMEWANGSVYGVVTDTYDAETLELVDSDSCYGFIGTDYAQSVVDSGDY